MAQDKSVSASLIHRSELPEHGLVALEVLINGENTPIVVNCDGERLIAWHNACAHQGRRLDYAPGRFLVENEQLICPAHGASFLLTNGLCVAGPCRGSSLHPVTVSTDESGELHFS